MLRCSKYNNMSVRFNKLINVTIKKNSSAWLARRGCPHAKIGKIFMNNIILFLDVFDN